MKPGTRNNIIYLAVGLGIAALATANFFYADSHGTKPLMPSRFAVRIVTTPCLLAYFVIKEMRSEKASFFQTLAAILFAILVQLGIMFCFRQIINELPGLAYSSLVVMEMFLVWQLATQVARYLKLRS